MFFFIEEISLPSKVRKFTLVTGDLNNRFCRTYIEQLKYDLRLIYCVLLYCRNWGNVRCSKRSETFYCNDSKEMSSDNSCLMARTNFVFVWFKEHAHKLKFVKLTNLGMFKKVLSHYEISGQIHPFPHWRFGSQSYQLRKRIQRNIFTQSEQKLKKEHRLYTPNIVMTPY